jgi:hypothetical protein
MVVHELSACAPRSSLRSQRTIASERHPLVIETPQTLDRALYTRDQHSQGGPSLTSDDQMQGMTRGPRAHTISIFSAQSGGAGCRGTQSGMRRCSTRSDRCSSPSPQLQRSFKWCTHPKRSTSVGLPSPQHVISASRGHLAAPRGKRSRDLTAAHAVQVALRLSLHGRLHQLQHRC